MYNEAKQYKYLKDQTSSLNCSTEELKTMGCKIWFSLCNILIKQQTSCIVRITHVQNNLHQISSQANDRKPIIKWRKQIINKIPLFLSNSKIKYQNTSSRKRPNRYLLPHIHDRPLSWLDTGKLYKCMEISVLHIYKYTFRSEYTKVDAVLFQEVLPHRRKTLYILTL